VEDEVAKFSCFWRLQRAAIELRNSDIVLSHRFLPAYLSAELINAAQPRTIHPDVGNKVAAFVRYGNIHWLTDFHGLLFRRRNNSPGIFKVDHLPSTNSPEVPHPAGP
jgi:hypothetical protein